MRYGPQGGCHLSSQRGLKELSVRRDCSFWHRIISPIRERMTAGEHSVVVTHAS